MEGAERSGAAGEMVVEEAGAGKGGVKEGFGEGVEELVGYCRSLGERCVSLGNKSDSSEGDTAGSTLQKAVVTSTAVNCRLRMAAARLLAS